MGCGGLSPFNSGRRDLSVSIIGKLRRRVGVLIQSLTKDSLLVDY